MADFQKLKSSGDRTEDDKSSKHVDTGLNTNLEQEPVIAYSLATSHAGKSSALAEWQSSYTSKSCTRENSVRCLISKDNSVELAAYNDLKDKISHIADFFHLGTKLYSFDIDSKNNVYLLDNKANTLLKFDYQYMNNLRKIIEKLE